MKIIMRKISAQEMLDRNIKKYYYINTAAMVVGMTVLVLGFVTFAVMFGDTSIVVQIPMP